MAQRHCLLTLGSVPASLSAAPRQASRDIPHRARHHHLRQRRSLTSSRFLPAPSLRCRIESPSLIPPRAISQRAPQPPNTRAFTTSPSHQHGHLQPPKPGEERHVTFVDKDGSEHAFQVSDGDNLLDIAQANDLEMEGACGGSCACSTCHVIVEDEEMFDKMGEPSDDENDMLDLAFGLTETSRLGCQVVMRRELDGLRVKLPSMTRNMQASDFAEKEKKS